MARKLKITQKRSGLGELKEKKRTLKALGLHKPHQTVEQPDNEAIRGMIDSVKRLVEVEEVD